MPRVGPRVALVRAIQKRNLVEKIQKQDGMVNHLLLEAVAFLKLGGDVGHDGGDESDAEDDMQIPFESGKKMFYNRLMTAMQLATDQDVKKRILVIMLKHSYLDARVPLPKSVDFLKKVLPSSPDYIFEQHVRMTRCSFGMLVELLRNKAGHIFAARPRGRQQLPLETQLHLALYCFGFYGNGAGLEQARVKFGYGVGTLKNARDRVVNALFGLTSEYITWPSASDRRVLCRRVRENFGFHNAFFSVDGTTHNFAFVPKCDPNSWYDRKSRYSMQALVTNDIDRLVINLVVGWPGSTHDARMLQSADYMDPSKSARYFSGEEHGVGDAAFGVYHRVIPNYKEPLASIPENMIYNKHHSKFRINSEHTIGMVKNRFQGIRELRMKISKRVDVLGVVKFITSAYVLHNILLTFDDSFVPEDNEERHAEDSRRGTSGEEGDNESGDELDDPIVVQSAKRFRETVKRQVLRFIGFD